MNNVNNPFKQHRQAILTAAFNTYMAEKGNVQIADDDKRVMLPLNLGDASPKAYRDALREQKKVDVAASAICRVALLRDAAEQPVVEGGVVEQIKSIPTRLGALAASVELRLTAVADRMYIGDELGPDGLVEIVRGTNLQFQSNPQPDA